MVIFIACGQLSFWVDKTLCQSRRPNKMSVSQSQDQGFFLVAVCIVVVIVIIAF